MSPPIGRLALFALVALLFVLACDSGAPTEEPCEPGRIIPGEYVVTLQDTTEDVPRAARRLADEVGGEVMGTWMNVGQGIGNQRNHRRGRRGAPRAPDRRERLSKLDSLYRERQFAPGGRR